MARKTITRRAALAGIGAGAAAVGTSAIAAEALRGKASASASMNGVYLIGSAAFKDAPPPTLGERVILRRELDQERRPALAAFSQGGQKLGYVAPRHAGDILRAEASGADVQARVACTLGGATSGRHLAGWNVATLNVVATTRAVL